MLVSSPCHPSVSARLVIGRFGADLNRRGVLSSAGSVFGEHLERFTNPRQALDEAYKKLASEDWSVHSVQSMADVVTKQQAIIL